jgi:hypothetical protein
MGDGLDRRRAGVGLLFCAAALAFCSATSIPTLLPSSLAFAQDGRSLYEAKLEKEIQKIGAEMNKINEEVDQLKAHNSPLGRFATYAGVIGGVVGSIFTIVIAILGYVIPRRLNAARVEQMRQDKELTREKSNLELFRDLASPNARLQLAAAAVLIQRLISQTRAVRTGNYEAVERKTIVDVLVAVIKEKPKRNGSDQSQAPEGPSTELIKYIADNIVKALDAVVPDGSKPAARGSSPLTGPDWQEAQLMNVWWKGVDARGIDFFQANFEKAGLAGAFLHKTTFYEACLRTAVLRGADLREANLQGADLSGANLVGADLTGALLRDAKLDDVRFDATTKWPTGFQPPKVPAPGPAA